jgi:putative endonuclease
MWFVYILRCADNSLYTGISKDVARRVDEHNTSRKGAKYTRTRRPVQLVWKSHGMSIMTAAKNEYRFKQLTKRQKEAFLEAA